MALTIKNYSTALDRVVIDFGVSRLVVGGRSVWVPNIPLCDADRGLGMSAQLTANDAAKVQKAMGARFLSDHEFEAWRKASYMIKPTTLPTEAQREELPRKKGETSQAYEKRIRLEMATIEWLDLHDALTWDKLRDWPMDRPVFNYGKIWIGIGKIRGWWLNPGYIQLGARAQHGGTHMDYATKTVPVWGTDPVASGVLARFTREELKA